MEIDTEDSKEEEEEIRPILKKRPISPGEESLWSLVNQMDMDAHEITEAYSNVYKDEDMHMNNLESKAM